MRRLPDLLNRQVMLRECIEAAGYQRVEKQSAFQLLYEQVLLIRDQTE